MSGFLQRFNRRTVLGASVLIASAGLLAAGVFSVISALTDDPVDLPSEGSLDSILSDSIDPDDPSALPSGDDGPPPIPPVRVSIPKLYVDAPVVALGTDDQQIPEVPDAGDEVAWYTFSATPGRGNAVFSGHVDWQTLGGQPIPGVFYRIRELQIGDTIELTLEDGARMTYRVTGNVAAEFDDPDILKAMGPASKDVVTLVTCGGTWFNDRSRPFGGTYSHRILVRAERVPDVAGAEAIAPVN